MPAGRRPKPTALKLIDGNPGKKPLNKEEPHSSNIYPDKPHNLSPIAFRFWDNLVETLADMNVLQSADRTSMIGLCEAWADSEELRDAVRSEGRVYTTVTQSGDTMIRPNPKVAMYVQAQLMVKAYLIEFGLTPAARSRVKVNNGNTNKKDDRAGRHFG